MGDVAQPEPEREAAPADEGPPQEFHFATLFDGEDTPVALRQLPRLWRAGLALVLAASRARVITTSVLMAAAAGAAVARAVPPPTVTGFSSIATDGLSFTYPGSTTPALADVTIEIPAGQVVALVGENGSGKTTLAKILAGLYGPTGGRLLVDGAEAAPGSVAVLFQDFVRYGFTAADNIAFGDPSRLDEEAAVKEAGARSGAAAVIERLPAGYETRLTRVFEEGVDLSVGQWQRVAIARALFRDAELVILDEPTAALDPRAEAELFDAMSSMMAGRTVVLISHRFSTVRSADRSWCWSGAGCWSTAPTATCWPPGAPTPSCPTSRPRPTGTTAPSPNRTLPPTRRR